MKQFLDIFDDSIVNTLSNFLCLQTFTFLPSTGIIPFDSRIIRSVFVLFVCYTNIIYTGIWLQLVESFPRTSFQVLNVMHYLIEAAISIIYVTVALVRTRNVIKHVNMFFKADEILLSLDFPIPFPTIAKEQLKIVLITLVVFTSALTIDIIQNFTDSKRFFIWVTEKIFLLYNLYGQLFFIVLLRNYVHRFDLMCHEIGEITNKKSTLSSVPPYVTAKIRLLMIHRALSIYVKILVHLNYKDSIPHLLQVISYIMTFTIATCIVYNHLVNVFSLEEEFQWNILSPVIAWIFFKISGLFILLVGTASVITQVQNMATAVHDLVSTGEVDDISNELFDFSLSIMHMDLQFTACDFFLLDYTLIRMIAGSVTSYLIYLIQFQFSTKQSSLEDLKKVNSTYQL